MEYNELKEFINNLKLVQYWSGDFKTHHRIDIYDDWIFSSHFKEIKEFKITEKDEKFLEGFIPKQFVHDNTINFYGPKNTFWKLDLKTKVCTPYSEIQPGFGPIFDLNRSRFDLLGSSAGSAVLLLQEAMESYEHSCLYDENNYSIEKEVQPPNEKYDSSYSLTKEESAKMNEWTSKHMKKYHKQWFKEYHGASPVSPIEVRWGSCSIGTYADCVCTLCEKAYNMNAHELENEKEAEKIKKNMSYNLRPIE